MSLNDKDPIGRPERPRAAGDGLRAGVDRPFTQADYERILGKPPGPATDTEYRKFNRATSGMKRRFLVRLVLRALVAWAKRKPLVASLIVVIAATIVWHLV